MILENIIKFLNESGWIQVKSDLRFYYFKPPENLGFDNTYSLPIPYNSTTPDYNVALNITLNVLTEIYEKNINSLIQGVENYFEILKKDAVYFKLSSNEVLFHKTLELNDIWRFLKNLTESYVNYLRIDFINSFKYKYNAERLNQLINPLLTYSKLRLVDLEYKSFSIGVSADSMMGNDRIQLNDVVEWRQHKVLTYKKEILDVNYSQPNEVKAVVERFSGEERKKIFGPIINSINSDNYKIYITDSTFQPRNELRKLPDSTVRIIIPQPEEQKEEPQLEIIQLITAVDKNKKSFTIYKDQLEGNLFLERKTEFSWHQESIIVEDKEIKFKEPITYKVTLDTQKGEFRASHDILPLDAKSTDLNKMKALIETQIINLYKEYIDINNETSSNYLISFFENIL